MTALCSPFPNFFIIGAPKCGTTALYDILRQHPEIYMSLIKEPHYFTFDGEVPIFNGPGGGFFNRVAVKKPADYLMLFAGAMRHHRAIGEASPSYLRSEVAAKRIHASVPDAKIIALLRQPSDRAYSHFQYLRYHGVEPISDFSTALDQENIRKANGWSSIHFYRQGGYYAENLKRYYDLFPRKQIKIYLYEEWNQSPHALLQDLFGFLGVDDQFKPEIRRSNVTLIPHFSRLNRLARKPEPIVRLLESNGAARLSKNIVASMRWINKRLNLYHPPAIDRGIRRQLTEGYRHDIIWLQDLIDRDLTHWLADKPSKT